MNVKPKTFQISFPSDLYQMKYTVNEAMEFINENQPQLNEDDAYDLKLVLNELLANAVVHGNKKNKDKNVYLQMQLKDNFIMTKVADEGKGFDYMAHIAKYNDGHLKESGRGIN